MRRLRVLLLSCALVLAGCAGIPDSSVPVVIGPAPSGANQDTDPGLGIQPGGPVAGSSIDQIVRGYINALTATDPEFTVARQYLDPDVAQSWQPGGGVTVISTAWAAQPGGKEGTVNFSADRVANVDDDGIYHVGTGQLSYEFQLVQVDGEWRIENPPQTLWIDSSSFGVLYNDVSLYFTDPSGSKVVPDVRYFREYDEQLANRLMRGLINGPSEFLDPGVRNEVEAPVKLRSGLKLDSEVVTVDLSGLDQKTEQQLKMVAAQITWTLAAASVNSVRITDNGKPISVPGIDDGITDTSHWASFNPDALEPNTTAYYISGGALFNAKSQAVAGPAGTGQYGITDAAVSLDGTQLATVSAGTSPPVLRVGAGNSDLSVVDVPGTSSFASPTWGGSNSEVWVVRNGTELMRTGPSLSPTIISAPSLADLGELKAIALSRDGTRLALLAAKPTEATRLYIAPVQRDTDAVSVGPAVELAGSLDVSAVAWFDSRHLALLGRSSPTGAVQPYLLMVDDSTRETLAPPYQQEGEPVAIAAAPGMPLLIAGSTLQRFENGGWVPLIGGQVVVGSKPFYPG